MLPTTHRIVGGESVFEDMEPPARLEDSHDLREGRVDIRDGAQREGRERGVAARVIEWNRSAVEPDVLNRHR